MNPGEYPFTRGIHPEGYRKKLWTMRQYSGFGTPLETNQRFKHLLEEGQTGLSIAFDLPTQMGLDSDHPRARGEVGRVGVSIGSVLDMELLLDGIPLGDVSISMTINATAPILVAMLQVVAERQGRAAATLTGTAQNDILKEYVARGTYIFPPRPSLRLATDLIAYCSSNLPKFNAISVSGYHMRDAGCTIEQEIAFPISNAIEYMDAVIKLGVSIDRFAPRISWIFNTQNDFLREVAKYRALRRIWAKLIRETYGALDPRSWQLRVHVQTGGSTLTAQQPENNIVRAAYQAMASVLGGVQSLALSCYDEAIAIPTEHAQKIALRTQQVLAFETGVTEFPDPLGGSPLIEKLTDEIEEGAQAILKRVSERGGAMACVESGEMEREIEESAYKQQREIDSGKRIIVGVNRFKEQRYRSQAQMFRLDPRSERSAQESLARVRMMRNPSEHERALRALRDAASAPDAPLMPLILDAVRAQATVGEISAVLRKVFGEFRETPLRFDAKA